MHFSVRGFGRALFYFGREKIEMEELLRRIEELDDEGLQEVVAAARHRYSELFPEWEVVYIALHKEPELRKQELKNLLTILEKPLQEGQSET